MDNNNRVRRRRKQQRRSMITNIVMCLITLSALTACIVLVLKNYDLKSQSEEAMAQLKSFEEESEHYIYTQADLDSYLEEARADAQEAGENEILSELKSRMDGGSNTAAVLRDFFPEDVVVYADGSYHFFPIDEKLKKHSYVYDNFKQLENGQIEYVDDTLSLIHI